MDVTLQGQYQHLSTRYALNVKVYDQHGLLMVGFYDQYQHLGTDSSCNTHSFEPLIVRTPDRKNPCS